MSEFKVGDKVVIKGGGWGLGDIDLRDLNIAVNETVLTISSIKGGFALFREFDGCKVYHNYVGISLIGLKPAATQHKRDELKAAIELVQSYRLEVEYFTGGLWKFSHREVCGSPAKYRVKLASILDSLLPLETPQQKKLKELEEQQRAIAEQMEQLRAEL